MKLSIIQITNGSVIVKYSMLTPMRVSNRLIRVPKTDSVANGISTA